jgi:hypothetical protein
LDRSGREPVGVAVWFNCWIGYALNRTEPVKTGRNRKKPVDRRFCKTGGSIALFFFFKKKTKTASFSLVFFF